MDWYSCRRIVTLFIVVLLAGAYGRNSNAASDSGPMTTIQASNNEVLAIYQDAGTIDSGVQQQIFSVMEKVTDFEAISSQATAGFCDGQPPPLCEEFKTVFITLLKQNALRKLGHYRADHFDYLQENIDGNQAVVHTIAHYRESTVQLDYHLHFDGKQWLVVNYITDEIDTIKNYRRQFKRIIAKESLTMLVDRLKKKVAQNQSP